MLVGLVLVYQFFNAGASSAKEVGIMIVLGIGFGAQMQNTLVAAQASTHQKEVAMTTAVRNFFGNMDGVLVSSICEPFVL